MTLIEAKGVNGQVSFDGQFVTIHRKGGLGRLTVGKGEKRIPISAITAVQWKPPGALVNGYIQFTVPGGNEGRSRAGHQTTDAAKDENAVVVSRKHEAEFQVLREAIEAAVGRPAAASGGVADELKKLADLHASGVLSDDEFAVQKAKLLG